MKGLEKLIADALQESDRTTIDEAIEEAEEELEVRQRSALFSMVDGEILMMIESSQMPMSTRHSGRTSLMLIQNPINVMVVIDISQQQTQSNSRHT